MDTVNQSFFSLHFLLISNRPIWPTAHHTSFWQDKGPQWWGCGTSETVLAYTKEIKAAEDSWFIFLTVVSQSRQGARLCLRSGSVSLWVGKTRDRWLMMCAPPSSSLRLRRGVFARTDHHVPHTLACFQLSKKKQAVNLLTNYRHLSRRAVYSLWSSAHPFPLKQEERHFALGQDRVRASLVRIYDTLGVNWGHFSLVIDTKTKISEGGAVKLENKKTLLLISLLQNLSHALSINSTYIWSIMCKLKHLCEWAGHKRASPPECFQN